MMFQWKADMVRFMKDAAGETTYYKNIASMIAECISAPASICDLGCGLGSLSLELAKYSFDVTAVDINKDALAVLKESCQEGNVKNIDIVCGDAAELLSQKPFDALVFCFYGSSLGILELMATSHAKDAFVIHRNYNYHRFSASKKPHGEGCYEDLYSSLDSSGFEYTKKDVSLEFNQPFRSFEDAMLFYKTYSREGDEGLVTEEFVRSNIIETGRNDFPFMLPHNREVSFVHIKAKE